MAVPDLFQRERKLFALSATHRFAAGHPDQFALRKRDRFLRRTAEARLLSDHGHRNFVRERTWLRIFRIEANRNSLLRLRRD